MIFDNLDLLWFFAALTLGLLVAYMTAPVRKVVVKFPSPFNAGVVTYRGEDQCFQYQAEAVACPADGDKVRPQPENK